MAQYALTPEDLARTQRLLDDQAAQVRGQFTKLANTVAAQTNRGAAADATLAVSTDLQAQAKKFDQLVTAFAAQIDAAKLKYVANAEAGTQAMKGVVGGGPAPTGRTSDVLAGNA